MTDPNYGGPCKLADVSPADVASAAKLTAGAADYAPDALVKLGQEAASQLGHGCQFSGVLGDNLHTYGYHRGRCVLPSGDYSVQKSLDKQGPACAAGAVDLSFNPEGMKTMTARLRASAKDPNDHRLDCIAEFAGTLTGNQTFNRDCDTGYEGWGEWDDSHLWHVHISVHRKYADDYTTNRNGWFSVLLGEPNKKGDEFVTSKSEFAAILKDSAVRSALLDALVHTDKVLASPYHTKANPEYTMESVFEVIFNEIEAARKDSAALSAKLDEVLKKLTPPAA